MSDGSSWWARQLGGVVAPSSPPPQQPQQQPVGYPQKAVRWQPQYPPTGPRGQEVAAETQPGGTEDDNWNRVQRQGFVSKAPSSAGKSGACPECNGSNFFKRRWANTEAAPLCLDCGFNGDFFVQSGTLLNAVGMKSSGPTQFARTDNPGAQSQLGVDASLGGTDFSWANAR